MSKTTNRFSPEVRERAVRMVLDATVFELANFEQQSVDSTT